MTITNGYLTSEEARSWVGANATGDPAALEDCVTSASRLIDRFCGRHFYQVTEARTFEVEDLREMCLGPFMDLVSVTTLKGDYDSDGSYETTISPTNYQLEPFNAALRGEPYTELCLINGALFPVRRWNGRENLVQITGVWGWPSVPLEVKQACRLLTAEANKLMDAPLGTAGGNEFGAAYVGSGTHKRALELLMPYRHGENFGVG